MRSQGFFGFNNQQERTAAERGYDLYGFYENRDDAEHLVSQLHGSKVHAFKLYKTLLQGGYNIRGWVVYVKTADLYKLRDDYRPPEKPKRPVQRGGRRKDMAIKVIKMRKEEHMDWEDIARELERSVTTVKDYFYRYSSEKSRARLTDWTDERRPDGYDPETGLTIRSCEECINYNYMEHLKACECLYKRPKEVASTCKLFRRREIRDDKKTT